MWTNMTFLFCIQFLHFMQINHNMILSYLITHHVMKPWGELEVNLYRFLTSALLVVSV
jgi:hypothetical protein